MNVNVRRSLALVALALGAMAGCDFFVAFSGGEPLLLRSVGLHVGRTASIVGVLCMLILVCISIRKPTRLASCLLACLIVAMIWTSSASNSVMSERYAWHVARCLAEGCGDRIDYGNLAVEDVRFNEPDSTLELEVMYPYFRRFNFVWNGHGRDPIQLSVLLNDERPTVLVWRAAEQASTAPDAQRPAR